jgi:hypothetical protein
MRLAYDDKGEQRPMWWRARSAKLWHRLTGLSLLQATSKAVDLMLAQLGGALARELTSRTRYRASGVV